MLIDAETAHGDFSPADVAEHLVAKLRAQDPELLLLYLEEHAVQSITRLILHMHSLRRAAARRGGPARVTRRSVFADAVAAHEDGDGDALEMFRRGWLDVAIEGRDGAMMHLRDCKKDNLLYAASRYQQREQSNRFERLFLEAIAKQVGTKTVGEIYTDAQLTRMRDSLSSS